MAGRQAMERLGDWPGKARFLALILAPRRKVPQMPKLVLRAAPNAGKVTFDTAPPLTFRTLGGDFEREFQHVFDF